MAICAEVPNPGDSEYGNYDITGDIIYNMRLVVDTNVLIAAIRSPQGASAALMVALIQRQATMLMSVALFLEYEAICLRPEHIRAGGTTEAEVRTVLNTILDIATPVEIYFQWRPQLSDADDELVFEAAANGWADAIVTFNERDFGEGPSHFGIALMRPVEALRRIRI